MYLKKVKISYLLLLIAGLHGCKDNKTTEVNVKTTEEITKTDCYQSIYKNDTLNLQVNTTKSDKITGVLTMKVLGEPEKIGKIEGKYSGDTLFADYSFTLATDEKANYKNPLALLRKDSLLILGNGQIETTMGRSYFVKNIPIDFERVRYKFVSVTCK